MCAQNNNQTRDTGAEFFSLLGSMQLGYFEEIYFKFHWNAGLKWYVIDFLKNQELYAFQWFVINRCSHHHLYNYS